MALTFTPQDGLGQSLPSFQLKGMDEKIHSEKEFQNANALLVMFICNHCPYVLAVEDRLIQLGHELKKMSIPVVAICSNDPAEYPEDNFANLKKRSSEKEFPFVYLHDPDQAVAKKFGAVCTPDFFVYDKKNQLAYRGRLDDSWKDASKVQKRELFNAIQDIAAGKPAPTQQTPSMGCNIKWSLS